MAPFRVKALYEYSSPHEDDLKFDIGQIITVTDEDDDDWYGGEYVDANGDKQEGIFPRNFVEKIEPQAPPRPTRARPKKDVESPTAPSIPTQSAADEAASAPPPPPPAAVPEPEPEPEPQYEPEPVAPVHEPEPEPAPVPAPVAAPKPVQQPKPTPAATPKAKGAPPPVSEKPSSFKDRIAAFNKPAAPPVAPFKPSGLGSGGAGGSGFIKKPFVAPPPSRHAFVPTQQQAPVSKVYRREEDPEIKQEEEENLEQAEKAGLVAHDNQPGAAEEDQPKPTSLKERIALLQQQQREQAQRHADAAAKKEKPKKPVKKPTEAPPPPAPVEEPVGEEPEEVAPVPAAIPPLPRRSMDDQGSRTSADEPRLPPPPRRKSSKGPAVDPIHDGNEADMSGAGDTTEGHDDTTEREDNEDLPRRASRVSTGSISVPGIAKRDDTQHHHQVQQEEEDNDEEEEDEDVDPEVKRKEELRARMAKMSGGMGFHGMFGMPAPAPAPPKKKKATKPEPEPVEEGYTEEPESASRAVPPVPTIMALPGLGGRKSEDTARPDDDEPGSAAQTHAPPPPLPTRTDDTEEDDETTPALTPAPTGMIRV